LVSRETNLSEKILDSLNSRLFRRTETGNAEVRERGQSLTKFEQTLLLSVDGELAYPDLSKLFESSELPDFERAINTLQEKALIEIVPDPKKEADMHTDLLRSNIEEFNSDDFFSGSLRPMQQGSGLVVDTHANKMKSVNLKKRDFSVHESFELSLGLGEEVKDKKAKRKNSKLVQVFPEPEKLNRTKKRSRSKRKEKPPENKWIFRAYVGLIVGGAFLALFSLFA
jgi:hypothetical protein